MIFLAIGFACAAVLLFAVVCKVSLAYVEKERQWKEASEQLMALRQWNKFTILLDGREVAQHIASHTTQAVTQSQGWRHES